MKKYYCLFIIMVFIQNFYLFSQSVEITCHTGGCFQPNPLVSVTYRPYTLDGDYTEQQGWTKYYQWSGTGVPSGNQFLYSVTWPNQPNNPQRYVNLTVEWRKTGNPSIFRSHSMPVTVKHIGPITSMTFSGGVSASPANGATLSLPCGVKNLTVTVPTPVTDPPIGVTYTWIKPSGWTGTSTTNTINLTTNAGANDGQVKVEAKRTDGNIKQTYTVNITRPRVGNPIITDISWNPWNKSLCSGETRQLTGTTANATIYTWSKTGGINITAGGTTPTVTINGTTNGDLTLTVNNACSVPKASSRKIFAGTPQINTNSDIIVDGHPNYFPQPNITTGSSYITFQNESGCQTYQWQLFGGSGSFYTNGNCSSCMNSFNGINFNHCGHGSASTSSNMALKILSANRCGQGVDRYIVLEVEGGGYYSMASPNPTRDEIAVDLDPEGAKSYLRSVSLVNNVNSQVVRSMDFGREQHRLAYFAGSDRVTFKVDDLPPGAYFLVMRYDIFGERIFKELIIIEK